MAPEPRRGAPDSSDQHGLDTMKQILGDQGHEIPASIAHAVLAHVNDAGVELVVQQHPDRLRAEWTSTPVPQAAGCCALQHLLLREARRGVLLKDPTNERPAFRIVDQALAHGTRCVDAAERGEEHRPSELQGDLHAGASPV